MARSLIVADTLGDRARYRLLEPVRQFAAEKLLARGEGATEPLERQLQYLLGIAETAEESILGGPDLPWLQLLDAELANIRSTLSWAFEHSYEQGCRLAVALIWYAYIRSIYDEGVQWAKASMRTTGRLRARAAHMAGVLSAQKGDVKAAERYLTEARDLASAGAWLSDLTMVMFDQAVLAYHQGDIDAMRIRGQEAVDLAGELGDDTRIMQTLFISATIAHLEGEHEHSVELWREAISHARERNAAWSTWMFRASLADVLMASGHWTEALDVVSESLKHASDFGDAPITTSYLVEYVGILAVERGEPLEGLRLMAAARATFDRLRYREAAVEAAYRRTWIEAARRDLDPARADAAWAGGLMLTLADATAEAQELVGIERLPATGLRRVGQATRTLMFTDVVGSTALIGAVGDDAWHELIEWHNRMLRRMFVTHQGEEIDNAGDGFFVAFPNSRAAADCAIDIQRMLVEHRHSHGFSPAVRIGLHETSVTRSGGAYRGRGVHLAARIAAQASGGEVLISSDTGAQLGGSYALSPPRSLELKGFRRPVLVSAIDWH